MSLIAHYKLNDNLATTNVIDSKVSYDGTLVGGNNTEDLSAVGKINESLHFDGNADYITTTLKFNAFSFISIALWVNTDTQNEEKIALANDIEGWDDSIQMGICPETTSYNTDKRFAVNYQKSNTTRYIVEDDIDISIGTWVHYIFTYDGTNMRLYRNNVLVDTTQASIDFSGNNNNVWIGEIEHAKDGFWDGKLDDIRVYNHILTETERNFIYNSEDGTEGELVEFGNNISANLKDSISVPEDISLSLAKTISKDIEFNLTKTILIGINVLSNLLKTIFVSKDIILNLQKEFSVSKDIGGWLAVRIFADKDLSANLLKIFSAGNDVSFTLAKEDIYDFDSDIRWKLKNKTDIGFALITGEPQPAGLDAVVVKINDAELTDVDIRTINWEWTMNDTPGTCEFQIARNFDNINETLAGVASPLVIGDSIKIYFNDILKYCGEIISFDVSSTEKTLVRGLDKKYAINSHLCSKDYGRHSIFDSENPSSAYQSTGQMLTYLLGDLVTKGTISSYTGIPEGVIVEYSEPEGIPYGRLITQLLEQSGTYKWNITPDGILKIYEKGAGIIKEMPYQESDRKLNLYDVLNCRLTLNNKSNLVTTAEVVLGTESDETYLTYRRRDINEYVVRDWLHSNEILALQDATGINSDEDEDPAAFLGFTKTVSYPDVFKRYIIPSWKPGDILDENYTPVIDTSFPLLNKTPENEYSWDGTHFVKTETFDVERIHEIEYCPYGFSISSDEEHGYIRFGHAQIVIKKKKYYGRPGHWELAEIIDYTTLSQKLHCHVWRPTPHNLDEYPTIFDIISVGKDGAGQKRRLVFSQLGISPGYTWDELVGGKKITHYVPPYNDTPYAIDRANYLLSGLNDAQTSGTIIMTLDAQDYFDLNLNCRINVYNTLEESTYRNNNGFPLDIESLRFSIADYTCTAKVINKKKYICTEDLPERSTESNILRYVISG